MSTDIKSPSCTGPAYELAQRFVGVWEEFTVTDDGEVLVGRLTSAFELDGCVFSQRLISADESFALMSFGYVDQQSGEWIETYVFNNGRHASYRWFTEGDEVITERIGGNPEDQRRLRTRFLSADIYEVSEARSTDSGESWEHVELTRTRRVAD